MLENVVDPIPYLQEVKTQAEPSQTHTGTALTYENYYELLILATMSHDKKLNGTLSLELNPGGISTISNGFQKMTTRIHFKCISSFDMIQIYDSQLK